MLYSRFYRDIFLNICFSACYKLSYVIEKANWSIGQDGFYITSSLCKNKKISARTTSSNRFLRSKIVHFGYEGLAYQNLKERDNRNQKWVLTWFHVSPESTQNATLVDHQNFFDIIHTSSTKTRDTLIAMGIRENKICVIPLGVDNNLFADIDEKERIRHEMKIPSSIVLIGSFQKDGLGWGAGEQPKHIKGPDILVNVIKKLSLRYPVHVLLTGPARGYIINKLRDGGVPFTHIGYLWNYRDIAMYYRALDLYLITSRVEGGPKSLLEAWAAGVPVVSTKVGMIPDIGIDGENMLMADVEDVESLYRASCRLIDDCHIRNRLVQQGLNLVKEYSWERIASRYYKQIYSTLLHD